jgi:hypothetical protein
MKSNALFACLPAHHIQTMIDAGALSRSDVAAINALRASGVSKARLLAKAQSASETEIEKDATPMTTADDILAERVAKAAHIQKGLREAISDVQAANPGISRRDAIDKVLFGPGVREMVRLEKQIDAVVKLGGGNLPTPRPGTMHNDSAPVLGRTGYDAALDDRPPGTATATGGPQSGADLNPIIRDHHQTLADIASGKINETDPKFRALRALEMKRLYEKG